MTYFNAQQNTSFFLRKHTRTSTMVGLVFVCVFVGVGSVMFPQVSHAFFSSDADAEGSVFEIGELKFNTSAEILSANIEKSATTTATFEIFEEGTIESQYAVTAEKGNSCSADFYNSIQVALDHGGPVFAGAFSQMSATSTTEGVWNMAFSASSTVSILAGETCEIIIHVRAWQHNFEQSHLGGFNQEKQIVLTLTAFGNLGPEIVPKMAPLVAPAVTPVIKSSEDAGTDPETPLDPVDPVDPVNPANPVDPVDSEEGEKSGEKKNKEENLIEKPAGKIPSESETVEENPLKDEPVEDEPKEKKLEEKKSEEKKDESTEEKPTEDKSSDEKTPEADKPTE